jgi:ERCC4-type nuclease
MSIIQLIADDRESRSAVIRELLALPEFDVTIARLPTGDYRIDNQFLVERKTLKDLVLSIQSGGLFSQALRLAAVDGLRPALVLEGTSGDLRGCGMSWQAIQGALVTVALFVALPVLRTRTASETAQTLLYMARQGRAVAAGPLPRRGFRPKGKTAVQSHILQSLPGIGPRRAAQLLQRFGNVAAVFGASESELKNVPGLGERTARCVRWAVSENGAPYVLQHPDRQGEHLARIIHEPPAATADPLAVARAAPSAGLDVLSSTPSPVFSAHRAPQRRLVGLATDVHE